jgi:echinoderm microtubule-associated protein-like 6
VAGIWPKYAAKNDINAVDALGELLAAGDDFGKVQLFKFPCTKTGSRMREYRGHSAHVTNVRFLCNGRALMSTGGADNSIFQWDVIGADAVEALPKQAAAALELERSTSTAALQLPGEVSDVASESGDSSGAESIDSDVEEEVGINYSRRSDTPKKGSGAAASAVDISKIPPGERAEMPDASLQLAFVHGYRGFDGHDNVHMNKDGHLLFYVAAVGVVMDVGRRAQRFYLGHTDDILCMAPHPNGDWVATGQVGRVGEVHVWSSLTLEPVSICKDPVMARGVSCVGFSADGSQLGCVALDDDHTLCVWKTERGQLASSTRCSKDKIMSLKFHPREEGRIVTVGVKHVRFWVIAGGGLSGVRATLGTSGASETFFCCAFDGQGDCFAGSASGKVYHWHDQQLKGTYDCHSAAVYSLLAVGDRFLTGSKDGKVSC